MMPLLYFLRLEPAYDWFYVCGPAEEGTTIQNKHGVGAVCHQPPLQPLMCVATLSCRHLLLKVHKTATAATGDSSPCPLCRYTCISVWLLYNLVVSSIQK